MMQYAQGFNSIEGPSKLFQVQNIRLSVFDILQSRFAGLSSRVSEARPADVDRKNARVRKILGDLARVLAGTAAGYENFLARAGFTAVGGASLLFLLGGQGSEPIDRPAGYGFSSYCCMT
jgi:hypothetical protein